jgi:hypothetical protein
LVGEITARVNWLCRCKLQPALKGLPKAPAIHARSDEVEGDADDGVETEQHGAFQPVGLAVLDDASDHHHRGKHRDDFSLRKDQVHRLAQDIADNHHDRCDEHRNLRAGAEHQADRQVHLVLASHQHGGAVFGGVADDGKQDDTNKDRRHAHGVGGVFDARDQLFGQEHDRQGDAEQHHDGLLQAPAGSRLMRVFGDVGDWRKQVLVCLEAEEQPGEVEHHQHDRDGQRHLAIEQLAVRRADVVQRSRQKQGKGSDGEQRDAGASAAFVELLLFVLGASSEETGAEDKQEVGDDRAGDGRFDDLDETGIERHQGDDQFAGIAKRGADQTTDGGSGVMRDVFACFAHDLGQRHDRQTGDEHDHDGRHLHVGGDEGQRYREQKTVEQFLHVRFLIGVDEWS